jgi:hypothetical protein
MTAKNVDIGAGCWLASGWNIMAGKEHQRNKDQGITHHGGARNSKGPKLETRNLVVSVGKEWNKAASALNESHCPRCSLFSSLLGRDIHGTSLSFSGYCVGAHDAKCVGEHGPHGPHASSRSSWFNADGPSTTSRNILLQL